MALTTNQRRAIVNAIVTNCGCKNERQVFNALSDRALYNLYSAQVQNEGADMAEENMYWEASNDPTANEDEYELDAAGNPILDESGNPKKKAAAPVAANEGEFEEEEFMENEGEEFPEEEFAENEDEEELEDEFSENTEGTMGNPGELIQAGQTGVTGNRGIARNRRRTNNSRRQVVNSEQAEASYLRQAPPRIREMLNNAMQFDQQRKNDCIKVITANANNMFTKEYLRTKSLKELRALSNLAGGGLANNSAAPQMLMQSYAGQGPVTNANAGFDPNDDLLPLPVTNFESRKAPAKRRRRG